MKISHPHTSRRLLRTVGTAVGAMLIMAGCASTPAPTSQLALSRLAISNATSAGGSEFAPVQFKSATEKMDAAERAMGQKNYDLARQMAEQAQVDAELATTTARAAKAKKAADALQESNRVLRQEIERKSQ